MEVQALVQGGGVVFFFSREVLEGSRDFGFRVMGYIGYTYSCKYDNHT